MSTTEEDRPSKKKQRDNQCNNDTCGICFEEDLLTVPGNYRTRLACGHFYHTLCLDGLFRSKYPSRDLCPVCRKETTQELRDQVKQNSFNIFQEIKFNEAYPYIRSTIPIPPGSFILTKQMFDLIDNKQSLVGATLSVYSPKSGALYENINELHFNKVADNVIIREIYQEQPRQDFRGAGFYYNFDGPPQRFLVPGSQRFDMDHQIYVVTPAPTIFARIIELIPMYYVGNVPCTISGGKKKSKKSKKTRITRIRKQKGRSRKNRRRRSTKK